MPDTGPVTFGRYALEARLARGGMGEVFLARMQGPAGFEKKVVIKRILPHLAESQEFVDRFLDEGRLVVQLTHGNIAQVFDMGNVDGTYFLAMEHVDGSDLRRLLRHLNSEKTQLPIGLALHIISQSARGLSYAHTRTNDKGENLGIIHRDVSPSNMMLSRHGEVKLLDFGIAKATSRMMESISGSLHGKFLYMSPEQASGLPLDNRSDLFSLGICAYETLTGQRPFNGDNDLHTLELVRQGQYEKPTRIRPEIPDSVEKILERCLATDPSDRFASAEETQRAIQEVLLELRMVVTNSDLAAFIEPYVDAVNNAPLGLDAALNQQLDALISPASVAQSTQMVAPQADVAFDDTRTGTPERAFQEPIAVDTATSRSRITQAPIAQVPPASRFRILIGSTLLVASILVLYNVRPWEETQTQAVQTLLTSQPVATSSPPMATASDKAMAVRPKAETEKTEESLANSVAPEASEKLVAPPTERINAAVKKPMLIEIQGLPADAVMQMNGTTVTQNDNGLYQVPAGEKPIDVRIEAPGHTAHKQIVERQDGATVTLELNLKALKRTVFVRAEPNDSKILVGKKVVGVGSHRFTVRGKSTIRGKITRPGYQTALFSLDLESPASHLFRLKAKAEANFSIRILPADAVVTLNNKAMPRNGKTFITRTVAPGKYVLKIRSADSTQVKTIPFSLEAGENKRLGHHTLISP